MQVYSTLDSLQQIVAMYKLQVYSTLDSLQQIVATLQVTDQSVSFYTFAMLTVCFQPISELLHLTMDCDIVT